jgi:hypothetical protein
MNAVRLPLRFDPARLQADLGRIGPDEWVAHFNRGEYEGDWSGVALRAVDGRADQIYPDPTATARYADTPLLARCPYLREVLAAIRCPLTAVRLLRLAPRSSIREHRDYKLAHEHGEARLHIPVVTNERVAFFLAGARVPMAAGETWYLNLELPHRVDNQSDVARVHLLVDCLVNPWLDALLAPALAVVPAARQPTAPRPVARRDTPFGHPTTAAIAGFLRAIGLEVAAGSAPERTVVPGIWIEQGALLVDEARLLFPGDLLHEAGHLAVMAPLRRAQATGDVGGDPAEEMLAIAWSYAAALEIGLAPEVVFHEAGYRGGAAELLENFAAGRYLAVPLLQWLGMAYDEATAREQGAEPYPRMRQWLRDAEESGGER